MLRADAGNLKTSGNKMGELLRLAESLEYEKDEATLREVESMSADYVGNLKKLSGAELESKKDEAKHLRDAFRFMAKFNVIAADFAPKTELDQIVKAQNWDKR